MSSSDITCILERRLQHSSTTMLVLIMNLLRLIRSN